MKKIVLIIVASLFTMSAYALQPMVRVAVAKCYQGDYNVVVNVVDKDKGTILPLLGGNNQSFGSSMVEFKVSAPQAALQLQASVARTGRISKVLAVQTKSEYRTGPMVTGSLLSANFPADFVGARTCP